MAFVFAGNELAKHLDEKDKAAAEQRTQERAAQGKGPKAADQRELGVVGGNPNAPAKPERSRGPQVNYKGPEDTKSVQRVDHVDGSAKLIVNGDKQPAEIKSFASTASAVSEVNKLHTKFVREGRTVEVDTSKIQGDPVAALRGKSAPKNVAGKGAPMPKAAAGGK